MSEIDNEITREIQLVSNLFSELFKKVSAVESKKKLYKGMNDLTLIEINTIIVIGSGEPKSMSEIANSLGVSFGTPTVTIDRLIGKDYVERIRDEVDRRQVFVKLSPKGLEVYCSIVTLRNVAAEKIFGILTPEERIAMIGVLSKLNNNFERVVDIDFDV